MEKNYQVVFSAKNQVELAEVPMPAVADDEVMIRTLVSQISMGTELTRLEGNVEEGTAWEKELVYPIYPGYSNTGEIIAVGKNIDSSLLGKKVLSQGRHVKYFSVAGKENYYILPENVDINESVFGIMAQISLGGVRAAQIKLGETVLVFGAGLIGQLTARLAKVAGALNVIVADISDLRLSMLPDNDSFIPVNTLKENVQEIIAKINNGKLADVVFETTGAQSLMQTEIECVNEGGRMIVTGSPKGRSNVDFDYLNRKAITVIGAHNYHIHPAVETTFNPWTRQNDTKYFLNLISREDLSLTKMITQKASYKDAENTYKMLKEDKANALAVHFYWED